MSLQRQEERGLSREKENSSHSACAQSDGLHLQVDHLLEQTTILASDQLLQYPDPIAKSLDFIFHMPHLDFGLVDIVHGFGQDIALAHFVRGHHTRRVALVIFIGSGSVMGRLERIV